MEINTQGKCSASLGHQEMSRRQAHPVLRLRLTHLLTQDCKGTASLESESRCPALRAGVINNHPSRSPRSQQQRPSKQPSTSLHAFRPKSSASPRRKNFLKVIPCILRCVASCLELFCSEARRSPTGDRNVRLSVLSGGRPGRECI